MKKLVSIFLLAATSAGASTYTLQEAFDNQETMTISPVTFNRSAVEGSRASAATLCQSLGYTRLVEFQRDYTKGENLSRKGLQGISQPMKNQNSSAVFMSSEPMAPQRSYYILKSVTCAK